MALTAPQHYHYSDINVCFMTFPPNQTRECRWNTRRCMTLHVEGLHLIGHGGVEDMAFSCWLNTHTLHTPTEVFKIGRFPPRTGSDSCSSYKYSPASGSTSSTPFVETSTRGTWTETQKRVMRIISSSISDSNLSFKVQFTNGSFLWCFYDQ